MIFAPVLVEIIIIIALYVYAAKFLFFLAILIGVPWAVIHTFWKLAQATEKSEKKEQDD